MNEEKSTMKDNIYLVIASIITVCSLAFGITGYLNEYNALHAKEQIQIDENGTYNSKNDMASYVYKYNHLPSNYVTKGEANLAGWQGMTVEAVLPGHAIGGDRFYIHYDKDISGQIEQAPGRYYRECDVETIGQDERGAQRLLFSNDGLVYYTDDHYSSFTLLYGKEVLDIR